MISNIAQSGINASFEGFRKVSQNVANINTDAYKAKVVNFEEDQQNGVVSKYGEDQTAGASYVNEQGELKERSNVRYENEATDMMRYQAMNKMNIKVLQAQDEMLGTILDAFA